MSGLLTTGWPYTSGVLLVSKGGECASLLKTRGGATLKEAAAYLSCTRPHYPAHRFNATKEMKEQDYTKGGAKTTP